MRLDDLGDAGPFQHLADRAGHDEQLGDVLHSLGDGEVFEQAPVLHDRGDQPLAHGVVGCHAVDLDLPGGRPGQAEDHVDRRGLASAVGAEKGDDFSGADRQVDPPNRFDRAEVLVHAVEEDGKWHGEARRVPRVSGRLDSASFHGSSAFQVGRTLEREVPRRARRSLRPSTCDQPHFGLAKSIVLARRAGGGPASRRTADSGQPARPGRSAHRTSPRK